ncbi:unnamed protein product [Miscanthus lutarioriparius]|uniref:Uncharacterized protein n=1 Tax=Miscanthus lutarioriparius TaxID=422564 RepID=A0A811SIT6_9POAL|nr:unnamed protein product [Miscanthus lutarioriparius]
MAVLLRVVEEEAAGRCGSKLERGEDADLPGGPGVRIDAGRGELGGQGAPPPPAATSTLDSVWASLPPLKNGSTEHQKPLILAIASQDSASFFRDRSLGSDSPISGLIALLTAVDALSHIHDLSNLKKQLDTPVEGLREWLDAVQIAGIPCAVASSLDRRCMIKALDRMALSKYFKAIVTDEDDMESIANRFLSADMDLQKQIIEKSPPKRRLTVDTIF